MDKRIWDALLNYESRELVAREYASRHPDWNNTRTTEIAAEVCASLQQARSYFESAEEADAAIKPLLLYYGALGLARGLVLFTEHKVRECNLDPRHGMTAKGWANELAAENGKIENLTVSLDDNGTFRELISAVSNRTLVRFSSSAVQWQCNHEAFPAGPQTVCLGDIIHRTPAIREFAKRWLGLPPHSFWIHSVVDAESFTVKVLCSEADRDQFAAVFGKVPWKIVHEEQSHVDVQFNHNVAIPYIWSEIADEFSIGSGYLVESFSNFQICQIGAVFVIAYFLGMLARYYPRHWTALIRNEKRDAALPTIRALVNYVERRFPAMVLDFLEQKSSKAV